MSENKAIEFKTTEVHRACSTRYYQQNKDDILKKQREEYRVKNPKKERIQLTVDDAVVFDKKTQRYKRNGNMSSPINPVNKSKHQEFLWIIENITGEAFEYDNLKWTGTEISNGDCSMCLCSTHIDYNYCIKHLPSGKEFIVGSECVKKISKDFYKVIKADRCRVCFEPVLDKRPSHGRDGYCSKECEFPKLKFGKHKGQRIDTIPIHYINWLLENITIKDEETKIAMYRAKALLQK